MWRRFFQWVGDSFRADDLRLFRSSMEEYNWQSFRYLIFGGTAASAFSAAFQLVFGALPQYDGMFQMLGFFLVSLLLYHLLKERMKRRTTAVLLAWSAVLSVWGVISSALFARNVQTFIVPLLILILPQIILAEPYKIAAIIVPAAVGFCILDRPFQTSDVLYHRDVVVAAVSLLLSWIVYYRNLRVRIAAGVERLSAQQNAAHDSLTGLYNRGGGEALIRTYLGEGRPGMFILMDVDDFKQVNDVYGHLMGDEILKRVAMVLKDQFRSDDVMMRMGGDEFIIYALDLVDRRAVQRKLDRVREGMHTILLDERKGRYVTVSIGCFINRGGPTDYETLVREADALLYRSKREGKDSCQVKEGIAG